MRRLVARWRSQLAPGVRRAKLTLQPLGLDDAELAVLRPLLPALGDRLALRLELQRAAGQVVLVGEAFTRQVPARVLQAWCASRPVVVLGELPVDASMPPAQAARMLARQQSALLDQLCALPVVQRASVLWGATGWEPEVGAPLRDTAAAMADSALGSGFGRDSGFDSRWPAGEPPAPPFDPGQQAMIHAVLRALETPLHPPLVLSYGPEASLSIDFGAGCVLVDPAAQQALRVRHELPLLAQHARPGRSATVRDLRETVWDLGVAGAGYRLLGEPANWAHAKVEDAGLAQLPGCTRLPRHLELGRCLMHGGPATPAALRKLARCSVGELRGFLQASLLLGMLRWQDDGARPPLRPPSAAVAR